MYLHRRFATPSIELAALVLCLSAAPSALAQSSELSEGAIADLSLEDLANTKIISVSRRLQPISDAAASVFIITGEQIRRSGAATLPEALRLAPNLQVAQVDARNYAVTARGFNNAFENNLLMLIDGRSVYTPLFSGVFWDAQDVVLEDVERIEVISGPGATMWGVNAVNGVINVITRNARGSTGILAAAAAQRELRTGVARTGAKLDNGGAYRLYAKTLRQDDTRRADGKDNLSGYQRHQAGFRFDTAYAATLQGDAYQGRLHQPGTADIRIAGANLVGRLERQLDNGSHLSVQAYWDFTERDQPNAFHEHLNTFDVQAQQTLVAGDAHQIVWGAGYRRANDRLENRAFAFLPARLTMHWGNAFVQDEIALSDTLKLTAGAKLEHNNYTGLEFLPTLRLAYKPAANMMVWSSLSRSVRAPSRIDRDFYSPNNPRIVNGVPQYTVAGGPDFDSEVANVAELGMRSHLGAALSYSVTAFASRYERLRTLEPNANGPGSVFRNLAEGRTRGIEMWGAWQASDSWRLAAGFVAQHIATATLPDSRDASAATGLATSDPSNFWQLRSSYDIAPGHTLDLTLRHQGALRRPAVPAYTAADLSYVLPLRGGLELNVVGRNLFDPGHPEYGGAAGRSEYRRTLYVKLVWQQ
jgi:iron complex outermembrane receptor protein